MNSSFLKYKQTAIALRKRGRSVREIENELKIPRSTLSGWFKEIILTEKQLLLLRERWFKALIKAREKAAIYHSQKKQERLEKALKDARLVVSMLNYEDKNVLKLALAMLFAGEGHKKAEETSLGNSNPRILKTFLTLIDVTFGLDKKKLRLYLYLRADQSYNEELEFWSQSLNLNPEHFNKIAQVDKRTIGKKTYADYHGVCVIRYYDVSIKRELLALIDQFFGKINPEL